MEEIKEISTGHECFQSLQDNNSLTAEELNNIGQNGEFEEARVILTHTPEKTELFNGLIHPAAGLYENPFDPARAAMEHCKFQDILRSNGAKVLRVKDVVLKGTIGEDGRSKAGPELDSLCELAEDFLQYEVERGEMGEEEYKKMVEEQKSYKSKVIRGLHPYTLFDILVSRPTVKLRRTEGHNTYVEGAYSLQPLMDLYFMRDQSITLKRGIVLCKMNSTQRNPEVDLVEYVYRKLGIQPLHRVHGDAFLEGGDYLPCGDIEFIGQGLRTNAQALAQLFAIPGLFSANRVVVVKDSWRNIQQMHLDTFFNIIAERKVVLIENRSGDVPLHMVLKVDVYNLGEGGKYALTTSDYPFVDFLKEEKFHIIPASVHDQAKYGLNFLTIRKDKICAIDGVSQEYKNTLEKEGVLATWMDFSNLTCGFGAAHCSSQVILRKNKLH